MRNESGASRRCELDVFSDERIPILSWAEDLSEEALEQARHLAALPFAYHHVALMPDAHVGYGMPIGGVFAAEGYVIPNAVGLDIGCGVRAWRTGLTAEEFLPHRQQVLNDIQRNVPVGREWRKRAADGAEELFAAAPEVSALHAELERARLQLGTLGSGNHFLEVQRDDDGALWAMVHSGSRNLGKQMATRYNEIAKTLDARSPDPVPLAWQLSPLPIRSDEGREYLDVMRWCLRFAEENRAAMQRVIHETFERRVPGYAPEPCLDVHHNYATVETHFGREVVLHRKGAVRAVGRVLVPGSMGTSSYVCEGLANPDAFESCAHGAGRAMGRGEAKRRIPVEAVVREMREKDIALFKAHKSDVAEEAAEAYKDIEDVMAAQADLVRPLLRLQPIGVVKG